jgi:hypothetical protein
MLPIAALILTDDTGDRFLGTEMNERAATIAQAAGIEHAFFVGRRLPDFATISRLRSQGIAATGLLEWPVIFSGVPLTELLVVLPARTVMEPEALRSIISQAVKDQSKAGLVVSPGPRRKSSVIEVANDGLVQSVMGDGNAMSTGVMLVPHHLSARISSVWSLDDAVHRLAKAGQIRALTSGQYFCRAIEPLANVASVERDYRRQSQQQGWKTLAGWMLSGPRGLFTTSQPA